MARSNFARS